ncbi:MAG: glycosyltransferase family 1 protein [Candidatus Alcyoniella australis]|nr:glycosyltransferase family 1 protein [Candidatus Alcyoniella australis]
MTLKIGIDARPCDGNKSGVGFWTYSLIRSLARIDRENLYYLYSNRPIDLSFVDQPNFVQRVQPMPISNLWLQTRLPRTLKRDGVDLFHGTNFIVPLWGRTPSVTTIYDISSALMPRVHKRANNIIQRLVPAAARKARGVIAVSEHTKADIVRHIGLPPEKVHVIYGAPGDVFQPIDDREGLERLRLELGLPERFCLFVGTLEPRKNIGLLLDAFRLLLDAGFDSHKLVIAGEPGWNYEQIFQRHEQLGLGEHVKFIGYVGWERLPMLYNLTDVFLFPSLYEGFGLPPLEAMACGTPAIVSDSSSLPEVVGEQGIKVGAHDAAALAAAIEHLLGDGEYYRQQVEYSLQRAAQFSWDDVARRTREVYMELAQ